VVDYGNEKRQSIGYVRLDDGFLCRSTKLYLQLTA